jgi:hypothetical protein
VSVTNPATSSKRAYRAAGTRHALITQDLRDGRLTALVGDLDARGAAVYDTGPIGLLDVAAVQALRDDLTAWLDAQCGGRP